MYDKFGEVNSADELNRMAAAQLEEGDQDAVLAIAKENGIDEQDAMDFIEGCAGELCTPLMAAIGKIKVEKDALKLPSFMEGWLYMLNDMLTHEPGLAEGVRKKGKKLTDLFGKLLKISSQNRIKVPSEIVKAAGLTGNIEVGDVDNIIFKNTVLEFYLR